jgi:nitrogenase molybdenum-cofactor synthesis protein NifE
MPATTDRLHADACRPDAMNGVCRRRGGESCAFDGAMIVLGCIADAAHLVHGPIACLGNSWESRGTRTTKGELHRRAFTTDLSELDIVYGAAEKLRAAIRETARDTNPRAIFVYATCVTGMIGEDIHASCREAAAELEIPVIPVDSPGFVGPKNLGNRLAGEVLLEHVIGTAEPAAIAPLAVNLVGEYNIAGDQDLIEPLLERAGFTVHARLTGNASFEEIRGAHRAHLNVVVCGRALSNVARGMQRRWGVPYVEASFFGRTEIARSLRAIAAALALRDRQLPVRVEALIAGEEARLAGRLIPYASLAGKKAVLYTGGVKSWSFISALQDLGLTLAAVGTKKATYEDEQKMLAILGPDAPLHENMSPAMIRTLMTGSGADLLVAGGRNQYLAIKEGFPFIDANQERHTAYAGYEGLVNLAQRMSEAIEFYRIGREGVAPPSPRVTTARPGAAVINPLRHSPALGAAMALQGVDRAAVIHHGAQGCSFLGKVLLTKHFREPIALVSTKVFSEDLVLGGPELLAAAVRDVLEKQRPDLVATLSSGLSEVKGDDPASVLSRIDAGPAALVPVATPDYAGGLEEGFCAAVTALVGLAAPGTRITRRVNILAGPGLTPADCRELRELITAFDLEATILPDLSALDGSRLDYAALAAGGTPLPAIRAMGSAVLTVALGASLGGAAAALERACGVPYRVLPYPVGLAATDAFLELLAATSGVRAPRRLARERRILIDGMRDAMTAFGGCRAALALETDAAMAISGLLAEMNASLVQAVVPSASRALDTINAQRVDVGDFATLVPGVDLLVAGSHGELPARDLRAAHFIWGFPVYERLGHCHRVNIGYRGTLGLVNDLGNTIIGGAK